MPRCSVVLPVRNGMPYLPEAVASILGQTYGDLELVISDNHSSDGTAGYLGSLADPRVRVVRPARALSLPAAHAFVVAQTTTELVALMGHDDVAHPERIARQVTLLDGDPAVALAGCWCEMIDAAGRRVGALHYATTPAEIEAHLIRNTQIVAPSMLFRRAIYEEVGGFTEDCSYAFDYDLVLRLSRRAAIANVPVELLRYRYNPAGASVREARTVQRGALRARWRALRAGGRNRSEYLWLLKPLLGVVLPGAVMRRIIVPYMRFAHGRAAHH